MRRTALLVSAIVLIVVGLGGMALVALFSVGGGMMGGPGMDARFIEEMVPHHQDAIDMAELALERSERPEIRQLAEDVRRSQSAENDQMREWYRDWYGSEVPEAGGGMGMMGGMTDLGRLERAEDFDREFLEQMIPHHEMALMMTGMMASDSERPEMRRLAQGIIEAQSREIEQMERWYREWYGG